MDRALGCLLGVAVGDAAGATLENCQETEVTVAAAELAMCMLGSQRPKLGAGQVTDDSELTISLARGLLGHRPSAGFPFESIAQQYAAWHAAGAFAGGQTCQIAFSTPRTPDRGKWMKDGEGQGSRKASPLAMRMQARAHRWCGDSKANGALMRITPLAIWGHRLTPSRIATDAALDASLSHPNPTCAHASAAYAIAVALLVANPGDAAGALAAAITWASEHADEEVQEWLLRDSQQPPEALDCLSHAGFVRHAFTLAFIHLRRQTAFESAICQTLCCGGDCDTNAAIVGGMMGALHGSAAVPAYMSGPVLAYESRQDQGGGTWRPPELRAAVLPDLARQLYELALADGSGTA